VRVDAEPSRSLPPPARFMRRLFAIAGERGDPSPADAVDAAVEVFLRASGTKR
jgi:hypothetical protein